MTHVCAATHPDVPDLRCWIATKHGTHDGEHFAVLPNIDTTTLTRPQVAIWPNHGGSSDNPLNHDDPAGSGGQGARRAGVDGPVSSA